VRRSTTNCALDRHSCLQHPTDDDRANKGVEITYTDFCYWDVSIKSASFFLRTTLAPLAMADKSHLVEQAVHWAASNGLTMLAKGPDGKTIVGIQHCPMTLAPYTVPQGAFAKIVSYALPFNTLVDRISRDTAFLYEVLDGVAVTDEFTANLLRISRAVNFPEGGLRQKTALGFHRSDYMLNSGDGPQEMQQIEINTISASFGVLSDRISRLHRFMQARFGQSAGLALPPNNVTGGLVAAINSAHEVYCLNHAANATGAGTVVIFVVQKVHVHASSCSLACAPGEPASAGEWCSLAMWRSKEDSPSYFSLLGLPSPSIVVNDSSLLVFVRVRVSLALAASIGVTRNHPETKRGTNMCVAPHAARARVGRTRPTSPTSARSSTPCSSSSTCPWCG
jgi:hypothetical protein